MRNSLIFGGGDPKANAEVSKNLQKSTCALAGKLKMAVDHVQGDELGHPGTLEQNDPSSMSNRTR